MEKKYDKKKDTIVAELAAKIAETKVDILRGTVVTGLTVVGLLSGIMFAMLNAYLKH